jgi:hypothetical protein
MYVVPLFYSIACFWKAAVDLYETVFYQPLNSGPGKVFYLGNKIGIKTLFSILI